MPGDLEVDPKGDQQQERNEKDILFTGRWGYFFFFFFLIVFFLFLVNAYALLP